MKKAIKHIAVVALAFTVIGSASANAPLPKEKLTETQLALHPKPLSDNVHRGLAWLARHQHEDGGWGQGTEAEGMGHSKDHLVKQSDVGDTCIALLAFLRSGQTPQDPYWKNITAGVDYVCEQIRASDNESLYITTIRDTRMQQKLGTYIDTFLASLLMAELKGNMADDEDEAKVANCLGKLMSKIERNQRQDGSFGGAGWANTLSVSMASKAINRAAQVGVPVSEAVRGRAEAYASDKLDKKSGTFRDDGSAGVDLYAFSGNLGILQDSDNTNKGKRDQVARQLSEATTEEEKASARQVLERFDRNEADLKAARRAVVDRLDDNQFIAGFGTNGGEEYLSYMNISESLFVQGGPAWQKWDAQITENLNQIQLKDGCWTGRHCITGGTFCTSAVLLTLMADRAPLPTQEASGI